ncbi:hypothetical protein ABFS82_04G017000 [Erythranthe guttata]|uniref:uncharacterized protein LOC105954359 n=1 Tax=Erythranthe guttata TaxID=4155 RepID=UPI00064DF721|nr:PREDICTED: uncharacterized protein LOC105954359 [Erythranthe guttata]|eukprot:XP_012833485.1 PREDICTED: uncharacterized protein LOC105954359 [Erythranthe guttata]
MRVLLTSFFWMTIPDISRRNTIHYDQSWQNQNFTHQVCKEYAVPEDKLEDYNEVTAQDFVLFPGIWRDKTLREHDVMLSSVLIDLTHGRYIPLQRLVSIFY